MPDTPSTTEPSTVETDGGTNGGTQTHEGFVPQADLEREQARARSFQSDLDRAKAELVTLKAAPTTEPVTTPKGEEGFDPVAFRRSLLADTASVLAMTQAVGDLKTAYPHADPSIYERLADFGNPDALRLAVEDSHNRVASAIDEGRTALETGLRQEFESKYGAGTPAGASTVPAGDPTIAQLNAMSLNELREFEKAHPGVAERVLRSN